MTQPTPTLEVTYVIESGYVRFVVSNAPAGFTVKRIASSGGRLESIVGFETDAWHAPGGSGYGEDYRPPIGETARYVLVLVAATSPTEAVAAASIVTPGNEAWLRDVTNPAFSRRVTVVSTGNESEVVRQFIYDISGRRLPLVVHDVREGRRGTVQLFVDGREERDEVEALLSTGRPLLLSMCSSKVWAPCMMAIGDATFTRFGRRDRWTLDLDYREVDDPWFNYVERIPAVTWRAVKDTNATWRYVRDHHAAWLDVALGRST